MINSQVFKWPRKHKLFDVYVAETGYKELAELVISAAKNRIPLTIDHMPVHGLMTASRNPYFRSAINGFDIVVPDGQPVRWALNLLCNTKLTDRVYGPTFMNKLCSKLSQEDIGIYLYGSEPHVLNDLRLYLLHNYPSLKIVCLESPPFRPLTPEEDKDVVERINNSGAGIVFLGLGCPKQEIFAYEHRERIHAVQICVGAAFDFYAGNKRMAPKWMQKIGLEWFFRLISEPSRLWKRYLVTNTFFIISLTLKLLGLKKFE